MPADAIASPTPERNHRALQQIRAVLHGDTTPVQESRAGLFDRAGRVAA